MIRTTTSAVLARTKKPAEGVDEIDSRLRRVMRSLGSRRLLDKP